MNELIFITHAFTVSACALLALRLGKEALIAFVCLQGILANLFVTKQITLFQLNATGSDAYTIGIVLGLNLLQEYYGKEITKKAIWISFFTLLFYSVATYIHLGYAPSPVDTMHDHFAAILNHMPRIVIASLSVYLVVQQIDAWFFGVLQKVFNNRFLTLRYCISISLCQLLDTVLFSFLGLYGLVDNLGQIIFISYTVKLAAIAISIPCVTFSKKLFR
ncbi:MAG TPA: queuosine precursor transporter [Candidatus Limnocylindria bacterium]|nr:queuosine precursor transporter [Candidatus Limnocylindria bacterium]